MQCLLRPCKKNEYQVPCADGLPHVLCVWRTCDCCQHVQVRKIADIMLKETKQRVATKSIQLEVGPRLLERIIQDGYSLEYGVRPLRQVRCC